MAQKCLVYQSESRLACGNCLPATVIICINPQIVANKLCPDQETEQPFTYTTIEGSVTAQSKIKGSCGTVLWKYTICYDEDQIVDGQTLCAADISGIFCKGCFAQWVEEIVGNEIIVEKDDEAGTVSITSQHGCVTTFDLDPAPFVPCVEDGETIDFELTEGNCITGEVIVSNITDNQIQVIPPGEGQGLYVPEFVGADAWELLGNAGNTDGVEFLGTTDDVPLTFKVNNVKAFRIQPGDSDESANIIGGNVGNVIDQAGSYGNVICGGGFNGGINSITAVGLEGCQECFIGCGSENNITNGAYESTILAGSNNSIVNFDFLSVILSGSFNTITQTGVNTSQRNLVGNGDSQNITDSDTCFILSGQTNSITSSFQSGIINGNQCVLDSVSNSLILCGTYLKLGTGSLGYQKDIDTSLRDLSAFSDIAYLGDIDTWIANTDGTARKLKLMEPNSTLDFSTTNYTSFEAQAQAANIEYKMPAAAGSVGQYLKIQGIAGNVVTLEWGA